MPPTAGLDRDLHDKPKPRSQLFAAAPVRRWQRLRVPAALLQVVRAWTPARVRSRLAAGGKRIRTAGPTLKETSRSELAMRVSARGDTGCDW